MGEALLVQKNAVIKTPDPIINITSVNATDINVRFTNTHNEPVVLYYELNNALPLTTFTNISANSFVDITIASLQGQTTYTLYARSKEIGHLLSDVVSSEFTTNASFVTNGLILHLDASNSASYPGSGTTWFDLSGNNNNFFLATSNAWNSSEKYMDFNGSYGIARTNSDISLSDSTGVTYVLVTRIKHTTSHWRTLTRSYDDDHHVIVENGSYDLGMYDNDGGAFQDSGLNVTDIPGYNTGDWLVLYWRWKNTPPYYEFSYGNQPGIIRSSISTSQSRYNRGFGALGGYHGRSTNPSTHSQYWGDIKQFLVYNRRLTDNELLQNYNSLK